MERICNLPFFDACHEQVLKENQDLLLGIPVKPAVVDIKGKYSYSQLLNDTKKVQAALGNKDYNGKSVGMLIPNRYEYLVASLGIWISGGGVVPLSLMHTKHELQYFITDSECVTIVVIEDTKKVVEEALKEISADISIISVDTALNSELEVSPKESIVDINGAALIVYTSGTTGKPKGVVLTHKNVNAQLKSLNEMWLWSPNDRLLHILPLHHVHGIVVALFSAIYAGATVEIMPKFSVSGVIDRIVNREKNLTLIMGVPAMYNLLLLTFQKYNEKQIKQVQEAFKQFRITICGSAPLQEKVFKQWEQITGHIMVERYGMSEIGMGLSNSVENPKLRFPGCVGRPLPGVSARLIDDNGNDFQVLTKIMCFRYYGLPEKYAESFSKDGWFKTGDIGVITKDGVFRLMGRNSTDIIKSGGYKLSAIEIERHILSNDDVEDVAVVSIPDNILGEVPGAAVVLKDKNGDDSTKDGIKEWCGKEMSRYKIPKYFVFIEELPRNLMKKVDKKKVVPLFNIE
ncbi:hypothetical protein BB558_002618 [Smittium angustum]|uniref:AMP-dependent synthetase/ligase domain-containing protein n=1 Tax=Smittium angustum TaxID=133377 RepID=A0A2U1J8B5_SMIAN|nr:hypothetical protein BB558_002618 [Smittium angustum]